MSQKTQFHLNSTEIDYNSLERCGIIHGENIPMEFLLNMTSADFFFIEFFHMNILLIFFHWNFEHRHDKNNEQGCASGKDCIRTGWVYTQQHRSTTETIHF